MCKLYSRSAKKNFSFKCIASISSIKFIDDYLRPTLESTKTKIRQEEGVEK